MEERLKAERNGINVRAEIGNSNNKLGPTGDTTVWSPTTDADFANRIKEAVARHVAQSNGMLKLQVRELVGKTSKERVCSNSSSTRHETTVVVRNVFRTMRRNQFGIRKI